MRRRLAEARRSESGYSIVELLTVMSILAGVMASVSVVMVSATRAETRMNQDFQAQTQARVALDRFRREGHAACAASPAGASSIVTFTFVTAGSCPASGGTQVSWCTVAVSASRYALYRLPGSTCDATGLKLGDYLTTANAFHARTTVNERATVAITLPVNVRPAAAGRTYKLDDDVVLRNSARPTS